jgi:hypothetical protein
MDFANAFIGRAAEPTNEEVCLSLGTCADTWKELVECAVKENGIDKQEWKSYSIKYGWSLRLMMKKRTIVYLSPCQGCFAVLFILGDRAVEAARHCKLPKNVVKAIEEAPRYPEGTGVRLMVKGARDLAAIRKLVAVKLAN